MSLVSIMVSLSQYLLNASVKMQNKAIAAIRKRIKQVEVEQVACEKHRSKQMIDCHNKYYADVLVMDNELQEIIAKATAKRNAKYNARTNSFNENKRVIAVVHQAASNALKAESAMLKRYHLTK